jgi:hypothetical protein
MNSMIQTSKEEVAYTPNLTGKADKKQFTEQDANPSELAKGIKVEKEHTSDGALAKKIALDHLSEIPDYYTRLDKMEKGAKMEGFDIVSLVLEKAKSKSQQRLFGMVHAVQKGTMKAPSLAIAKMAKGIKKSEVKKFAETKTKDLPERVKSKK